jgi:hypothetical protein
MQLKDETTMVDSAKRADHCAAAGSLLRLDPQLYGRKVLAARTNHV